MLLSLVDQMVAVGDDAGVVLMAAINVADGYECKEHCNEYPERENTFNQRTELPDFGCCDYFPMRLAKHYRSHSGQGYAEGDRREVGHV